ncbi:MAG: NADH-quinone oxidoreductase subunit E, partial [Alistipes sp.]|nr:NADH-quinone oxidoreductase subunit E [Alistipes sp.]
MFYLYLLLTLALLVAATFIAPLRHKVWVAFTAVTVAAVAVAIPSIGVLAGAGEIELIQSIDSPLGVGSLSIDALSAMFLLIIGLAGMATILYSRGYLAHYLTKKSSAHISLHYTALALLVLSMMLVVMADGSFLFLFAWELMTIASFLLIL